MRVAWIGPSPAHGGGVAYLGSRLIIGLARAGVEIDCFLPAGEDAVPAELRSEEGLDFVLRPPRFREDGWYARSPLTGFVTGQLSRAGAQTRLTGEVAARHAKRPYDWLYQFSQIELGWVRRLRDRLPPIVLHPEVHAAGELRWHRRESDLSRRCEPLPRRAAVRAMLQTRSWIQQRDLKLAAKVVAPSERFRNHLIADYGVSPERAVVVPNLVDTARFSPAPPSNREGPVELLFVSRMSVRKGVEMVVALSHRIADLAGRVRIRVVGDRTLWSDYRCLLDDLDPRVAVYPGGVPPEGLPEVYRSADALIQPSHYEPFGLTVAEALASGLPVVASDEVGAAEGVDERCCRRFPAGDINAFEREVRGVVEDVASGDGGVAGLARAEAERLYSAETVVEALTLQLGAREAVTA